MHSMFICMFMLMPLTLTTHISRSERQLDSKFTPLKTEIPGKDLCKPQHVHISFGDNIHQVNIVWSTEEHCTGEVMYGTSPWNYEHRAYADYRHFTDLNSNGLQHIYRVKLQGLLSSAVYYYEPINNESTAGPFYFQVPPDGNGWSPDFLVFGDFGIHADTMSFLINEALSGHYTALIHVGDIAYDLKDQNGLIGDYFMKEIEPMAAYIPYLTCPGNHEIDFDTFSHYRHRFSMPKTEWPIPIDKMWYSIDIGLVHFVSYSSEVFFTNYGQHIDVQKSWLIDDLTTANSNRKNTPWIVAFGHRPMYCSTKINDDCSLPVSKVRNGLEEIFVSLGVDLIIQAHEHNYERLWPLYKWDVLNYSYENLDVPVQIITGAAGSIEGSDMFPPSDQPLWSAFRLDAGAFNSYGRLLVANFSHMFWEQRSVENHTTLDSIWIVKDRAHFNKTTPSLHLAKNTDLTNYIVLIGITLGLFVVIPLFLIVRLLLGKKRIKTFSSHSILNDLEQLPYKKLLTEEDEDL